MSFFSGEILAPKKKRKKKKEIKKERKKGKGRGISSRTGIDYGLLQAPHTLWGRYFFIFHFFLFLFSFLRKKEKKEKGKKFPPNRPSNCNSNWKNDAGRPRTVVGGNSGVPLMFL